MTSILELSDSFKAFYKSQRDVERVPATTRLHNAVLNADEARVRRLLDNGTVDVVMEMTRWKANMLV